MRAALSLACVLALSLAAAVLATPVGQYNDDTQKFTAGYILISAARNGQIIGLKELSALAANAESLPVDRVVIGFFAPTMVYKKGSNTLEHVGLNVSQSGDFGFASIKKSIAALKKGGVSVYLSMGGWNYNCWPYMYTRYSVAGYGTHTPNYFLVQQYGDGDVDNCVEDNQWCFTCEPPSEGTSLESFSIFPEVPHSDTWQKAAKYVEAGAKGNSTPKWDSNIVPGRDWTDPKTNLTIRVPGSDLFVQQQSDPYGDIVDLAVDLDADGIDADYEEFWHADYFKYGNEQGPWWLPQTVYKYSAIIKTFILHIQDKAPHMRLSTAASAVGGASTAWWGGNLKGVWYFANLWYPEIINFMSKGANAGGINVMTYDLSDNPEFHECPEENICSLSDQVEYYMKAYDNASIVANVGYEIGTPAYPSPTHDPTHQLPLTKSEFAKILSSTQPNRSGFFWELFKPINNSMQATPTDVAQGVCKVVTPDSPRCKGTIPTINSTMI